jgi:hypothetical protein
MEFGVPLRTWRPETPPSIAMRLAMARPYAEIIWPSGHLKSYSRGCTIMGMTRFSYFHHIWSVIFNATRLQQRLESSWYVDIRI